jgi:hypothetical protein
MACWQSKDYFQARRQECQRRKRKLGDVVPWRELLIPNKLVDFT